MKLLTDEKELAELVKLCAAATPRPWIAQWHYWDGAEGLSDWYRPLEQEGYEKHCTMQVTGIDIDTFYDHRTYAKISRNDLLFVSRARTDLPRAVATIRALKAQVEKLDEEIRQLGVDKQHLEQWAWQTFGPRFDPWGRQKLIQVAQEFERSLCAAEEIAGLKARVAKLEQLHNVSPDDRVVLIPRGYHDVEEFYKEAPDART